MIWQAEKFIKVKKIEYPDYESPACTPVKMYLQGEFGGHVDDVYGLKFFSWAIVVSRA